jgi:solute carrier family 15 (oligopeptide transporter), member 1
MSTALYHTYEFLIYFFIIFGTIIAESWLGLFKTLVSMTLIYSCGAVVIAVSGIETIGLPVE